MIYLVICTHKVGGDVIAVSVHSDRGEAEQAFMYFKQEGIITLMPDNNLRYENEYILVNLLGYKQ